MSDYAKGAVGMACFYCLLQDVIGKEEWLRINQEGWIAWYYAAPVYLPLLLYCLFTRTGEAR